MGELRPGTRVVHAGLPEPEQGKPFLPGPVFAAPYHLSGDPATSPYGYGRENNPTWAAYESAVAELDNATAAVAFASGMAACTAVLLTILEPGDVLVASAEGYPVVRTLASEHLAGRGVETRLCRTDGDWEASLDGARLVWVESPTNPELRVTDIGALAGAAHARGALVAVDNTMLTPLLQQPLELGADLAVYADTKAMNGHSDLLLGHVAVRDEALAARLHDWRTHTGSVPGPFETWLAHRSLATLDVRLERQCVNARAIAELLGARHEAVDVRTQAMIVAFTLDSAERAERFLAASALILEATSFGGVHTSGERRARWGHGDDVPPGFIRLSCGVEATQDLVEDVQRALESTYA